jgi:hypothetical protein
MVGVVVGAFSRSADAARRIHREARNLRNRIHRVAALIIAIDWLEWEQRDVISSLTCSD